jgi:hypothetical protein
VAVPEPDEITPVHDLDDHAEALTQLAVLAVLPRDEPLIHARAFDVHVEVRQVEVRRTGFDYLPFAPLEDERPGLVAPLDPEPIEHLGERALDGMGELPLIRAVAHL